MVTPPRTSTTTFQVRSSGLPVNARGATPKTTRSSLLLRPLGIDSGVILRCRYLIAKLVDRFFNKIKQRGRRCKAI